MSEVALEVTLEELDAFLQRMRDSTSPEDYELIRSLVRTVNQLSAVLGEKNLSMARLKAMLFGASTERTKHVAGAKGDEDPDTDGSGKGKKRGHGHNGAEEYSGAVRRQVAHATLKVQDECPSCARGKLYRLGEPARVIKVVGQPFLDATVWEAERLRCNTCCEVFGAKMPPEALGPRYDPSAGAMISVLKYGSGMPFYRLEKHQKDLGVPVPASVAWEIVEKVAEQAKPVHAALVGAAAQGEVMYNDDTTMKILAQAGATPATSQSEEDKDKRTGTFTTGIVSQIGEKRVTLFYTGRKHAGENLNELLRHRQAELRAPIQMCDALDRNEPTEFDTLLANCLAHGRRKFVEIAAAFPAETQKVLDSLRDVYRNDARSRKLGHTPAERLANHQETSAPVMDELKSWLDEQLTSKKVEPNSSLGKAITYLRNHWQPLTLFLREAGAPLDNNVCERALKMAILHRKNSLFYKTEHGAAVGDTLMSLIYTCRINGANSFAYLKALLEHPDDIRKAPGDWLPWNYTAALARGDPS